MKIFTDRREWLKEAERMGLEGRMMDDASETALITPGNQVLVNVSLHYVVGIWGRGPWSMDADSISFSDAEDSGMICENEDEWSWWFSDVPIESAEAV